MFQYVVSIGHSLSSHWSFSVLVSVQVSLSPLVASDWKGLFIPCPPPPFLLYHPIIPLFILDRSMDSLEGLWNKLSLFEAEKIGVSYPKDEISHRYIQAAKFLTKRVVNISRWLARSVLFGDQKKTSRSKIWVTIFSFSNLKTNMIWIESLSLNLGRTINCCVWKSGRHCPSFSPRLQIFYLSDSDTWSTF